MYMKKHVFLTGPSGFGKTKLICSALGSALACAGGYITDYTYGPDGKIIGCELVPAASAAGVSGFCGQKFLDLTVYPPRKNNEVFRSEGVRILREAGYYPFSVLDKFGGIEMVVPEFRNALTDILSSPQPIIGAIMDENDAEDLRKLFGLGSRYTDIVNRLMQALRNDPDTMIVDVSKETEESLNTILTEWAKEYTV